MEGTTPGDGLQRRQGALQGRHAGGEAEQPQRVGGQRLPRREEDAALAAGGAPPLYQTGRPPPGLSFRTRLK